MIIASVLRSTSYRVQAPDVPALWHGVEVEWNNGDLGSSPLHEFLAANEFEPAEIAEIKAALRKGDVYKGGGGAAAEWSLWIKPQGTIPAHILQDCTAQGISSRADELAVVNAEGPHNANGRPLVAIVPGNVPGTIKAVPVIPIVGLPLKGTMMGGNFLHSSDSRFREICEAALLESWVKAGGVPGPYARFYGAVAIHDRIEA